MIVKKRKKSIGDVIDSFGHAQRRSQEQPIVSDSENNEAADRVIADEQHNNERTGLQSGWCVFLVNNLFFGILIMHRSTKTGLIAIAILICLVAIILLINLQIVQPGPDKIFCVNLDGRLTCQSNSNNSYRYYGTKTAYHVTKLNKTNTNFNEEGCVPITFYLFSRHATRYPDKDDIEEMNDRLPYLKEKLVNSSSIGNANICEADIEKLKLWEPSFKLEHDNRISSSGEEESRILAEYYKMKFPEILNRKYSPQDFVFEYTSKERTQSTADSFAKGLFGGTLPGDFSTVINDKVLSFHKECKSMQKKCKNPLVNVEEVKKFEKGTFVKLLIESVSKRLGFQISYEDIQVMYRACIFEYALHISDVWCSVFSHDDLKVLEYEADIDDYYKDGYGNDINYKQACPVVSYIVNLIRTSINQTNAKAVFQFTHAGAVKKVYARFGLYKDSQPLTAEGLCFHDDRKWRSSIIAPFNTNLAIILFHCKEEYKLIMLHNEEPVLADGCSSVLCPAQDFLEKYNPISENCDIKNLCCSCCVT